ncbi:MAG: putative Ig domain-containing protein [Planctomycetota bacterium]
MHFNWLQGLLQKSSTPRRATTKRRPYASEVETLETRVVPAIYTVTGYADGAGATTVDGANFNSTTLRAALTAANATPEADTIVLAAGTYTINTEGEGQLTVDVNDVTIDGAGADLTIIDNGNRSGRVLQVVGGAEVTLDGVQITGGNLDSYEEGAGIYINYSTLHLINSSVVSNTHTNSEFGPAVGGGIGNYGGTLTITDSTVAGNEAYGGDSAFTSAYGGYGAGIATRFGTVTIENSTISGNSALGGTASGNFGYGGTALGGGVYSQYSTLTIINSTIANNTANGGQSTNGGEGFGGNASGGGLYIDSGTTSISNSTIAFNQGVGGFVPGGQAFRQGLAYGGGIVQAGEGSLEVNSTIIAKNTATLAADVVASLTDGDYNLIGDVGNAIGWTGVNSLVGGGNNPLIDPLFATTEPIDNGGLTLTLALAIGSPAIDAGSNVLALTYDQRGDALSRVFGASADIGAFEVQSISIATSGSAPVFIAGGTAVVVDSGVTISGADEITGATAQITVNFEAGQDVLTYPTQIGNITGSYLNGILTLSGTDTIENYNLALRSITYSTTNLAPASTIRGIAFSASAASGSVTADPKPVNITILNVPPTVQNVIPPQTATEDSAFTFTFAANTFGDVDIGDSLTYTATGLPSWLSFDGATRTFTGTPANGDVTLAPITITVTATDESEATVSTTFTLTVVNTNDAPTVSVEIPPQTATEDAAFSFTFDVKTFVDVDLGDTLTYTASGLPAWLSFDAGTRTFSGTPANSDVTTSPLTITVTATDTSLASVSTTFALTVENVNDAPTVANLIPNQFAPVNALFSFTFAANTFADIDVGDTLTYSVTGLPAWLSFDAASRTFTGTPTAGDAGSLSTITVTATDNHEASVSTTFDVTVGSIGPNITVTENQGTYYLGKVRAFYDPTAGFTNPGSEVPDYSAAQLTVSIVAGRSSRDVLSILSKGQDGPIRVKGKNIFYGDVKIGTVSGGKGRQPVLVVTFNAQTTTASIDALMRRVNFTAKDDLGTVRTVHSQVTNVNNGGLETVDSNVATRDIQVVRTNGPH